MKIIRHPDAESIALAYFSMGDVEVKSLDEVENVGGHDEKGAEVEVSVEQWMTGMRENGFWGFIDEPNETVHLWLGDNPDPKMILTLVGHELGHATGEPATDSYWEEERAMGYGRVAAQSYAVMRRLLDEPELKEFEVEPEEAE